MRIVPLAIALSVLSGSWALPLTQKEKREVASSDPSADSAEPSPNGCFVIREDVRNYTM